MSNPPETPAELTASDVLASDIWTGRAPPPVLGLDVGCTKIAVDFQNLRRPTADECIHRNLERFAELHIGSLLMVVFHIQGQPAGVLALARALPRGPWDVNVQLLLKLIGTSLGTGLERLRMETRLAKLEERMQL